MQPTKRQRRTSLIERVIQTPQKFCFIQCVWIISRWLDARRPLIHGRIGTEFRFKNSTSLSFPTSEVAEVAVRFAEEELDKAHPTAIKDRIEKSGEVRVVEVTPTFFGMLGTAGALPYVYSELIDQHVVSFRSHGPKVFFDALTNRAIALHYLAAVKYRPHLQARPVQDFLSPVLHAIAGRLEGGRFQETTKSKTPRGEWIAYFAAALQHRPVSTAYMNKLLRAAFGVSIRIDSLIGAWYTLSNDQRSALGIANADLGSSCLVGTRVWQRSLRQRVNIGPMDMFEFRSFLPGQTNAQKLETMLMELAGSGIEYEICLTLQASDASKLSASLGVIGTIGEDAVLYTSAYSGARTDVVYLINAV